MEWKTVKFEDTSILFIDGDRGKNYPNGNDFLEKGHCIFLNAGNVTKNGWNFKDLSYISEEKDNLLRNGKLQYRDVVLTTRGTVGNVVIYTEDVPYQHIRINSGMVIIRDNGACDAIYLYQFLRSKLFLDQVVQYQSGSAQPQLPISALKKLTFSLPDLDTQRRIAAILSSLDDKIENNNRINRNLEAQAQALFKSWFVDFEPWGGTMPDDWKEGTMGEICSFNKRKIGPKFANPIQYLDTGHLTEGVIEGYQRFNPGDKIPSSARRYVGEGDILFSLCRPNMRHYGLMMNPPENIVASTGFAVITANWSGYRYYIYQWLKQDGIIDNIHAVAEQSSTTYPTIDVDYLAGMTMVIPAIADTERYAHLCCDLYSKIESNYQESHRLATLRDTLLPKLMKGDISL